MTRVLVVLLALMSVGCANKETWQNHDFDLVAQWPVCQQGVEFGIDIVRQFDQPLPVVTEFDTRV